MSDYRKVIVTGGAGQLGRYVVAELARGYDVTVFDPARDDTAPRQVLASVLNMGELTRAFEAQDAVIHLAGIDAAVEAPPELVFATNVQGTWNVLHAAEKAGIDKAVICSSVAASGFSVEKPIVIPDYLPVDEAHPLRPCGTYGLSKMLGEYAARSIVRRGRMRILCLRPALVAFPHWVQEIDECTRVADGDQAMQQPDRNEASGLSILRAYVTPEDCARCFRQALEADAGVFDSFYVRTILSALPRPSMSSSVSSARYLRCETQRGSQTTLTPRPSITAGPRRCLVGNRKDAGLISSTRRPAGSGPSPDIAQGGAMRVARTMCELFERLLFLADARFRQGAPRLRPAAQTH
ncbi:MAG: NAD-dependent epimerase/dehydratase family protein [Gammaproteobacteria bacterium]